ncbi:MAG: hypothetical protein U5P41_07120 [Gammaproteobacteria bacterium]|nr:hypothetical protein [Gammaproteobacteria bacterium]
MPWANSLAAEAALFSPRVTPAVTAVTASRPPRASSQRRRHAALFLPQAAHAVLHADVRLHQLARAARAGRRQQPVVVADPADLRLDVAERPHAEALRGPADVVAGRPRGLRHAAEALLEILRRLARGAAELRAVGAQYGFDGGGHAGDSSAAVTVSRETGGRLGSTTKSIRRRTGIGKGLT